MMPAPVRNAPKGKGGKNGGKGGGQQGGGNKKRKKENGGPVKSIDESMVEQMSNLLFENGGEIDLGSMTSVFPGLKKAQIEEHFDVHVVGDGDGADLVVTSIGAVVSEEKREKAKQPKAKKEKDPDAPPPPDLGSEVIAEITAHLEDCGGSCVLGKLSTVFSGIKKAQLEAHFDVEHGEKDSIVRLFGHTGDMDAIGQGPAKKRKSPMVSGESKEKVKKEKKAKKEKDPNAPPPPDLEAHVINEITAHLEACGGSCVLGKLGTKFPGIKKVQLEAHFDMENSEKDSIVRLLGNTGDSLS